MLEGISGIEVLWIQKGIHIYKLQTKMKLYHISQKQFIMYKLLLSLCPMNSVKNICQFDEHLLRWTLTFKHCAEIN
jgi:hypothetical protein